jgi:hypothetical protein
VDWGTPGMTNLPLEFMSHIKAKGTVPMIIWQPVDSTDKWNRAYSYKSIRRGDHDPYIKSFAQQVSDYGGRVLIRFAHEFDGGWYPWGVGKPGNSVTDFKVAWRRIFRIFRVDTGEGTRLAPKAHFIWSPQGSKDRDWMTKAFPGSQYVDYLGFTAFNWATYKRLPWYPLSRTVAHRMSLFSKLPRKRVIITETGSDFRRRSKAAWLRDGYAAVYKRWPRIVAIAYFNVDMRDTGDPKHPENWSLDSPADGSARRAYRKLLTQTRFRGSIR